MRVTTLRDTELDLLINTLITTIMNKELLDKARSEIRAKMEAKPFEELEQDWMHTLDNMYGVGTILRMTDEERAKQGSDNKKIVAKAVYRSFSRSAIIFFEEFLKIDDERRTKG